MNEQFEFKSAANGQISLDQAEGIVECFVAGIGNKDSVGDIVVTGAFAKSLTRRKPRVVWAHSWNDPIGKVLEMYEVPPGDPRLPAKMRNAGIGGLYAKVQFNLQSEKGKEAFASVAFFGEEQEWSIGYKTINGAFDPAQQANVLKEVELYEVSPVLHGANQLTGTISVKSEQKNHMMPVIAGMPMMGEQQQPRMIVIAAPEKEQEQDEPFNIFAEGLAQPLAADKVQKIQAELSERTGSKVDIVEATDSFIVFRRTTTDGKVSMYRVGYHTPDDYNTFMFGKPEAYSGNDNKPQIQQEIEVKPADASMVPMQPQQVPYRDDDQDEMNTMLGGQVGVGKSAYAHLIEIPQIHMVQAKSMLQPVFNYHKLSTTDSDNGIIVNGSISAQAIDALQTAVKAIGQTIGQSVGNLRTLAQSFNPFAIDGDNDGFAQDGTAFQRPYIPIKKPDMELPEVGGKKRNSSELLDKPTIRTGKKPTKDPSLLQGQERQEALAAGELQPRTMDDISFLANRRPENEGLAKYWDMSEDGLRAEGQKLVAARRGQTGSAREATDGELFKISHEFARREAYKQQFGKDFVPPKRTESTGRETFDVRDVEATDDIIRPAGRQFTGYNPAIERDKEKQRMAKLAEEAIAEYEKGRSKRGFSSRGDVTLEQQRRIDASRKRGADIASGRAQILADNLKNLSDEDKDTIREEGIVSFLLQDGTGGPLSGEWAGDSPAERIGDLLPEGDWSTDSGLQADAEDIFASYEEGFYGQLDKEFADLVNPADLDTPKAQRDRQRAAGQGELFDDFDSLSADEQDSILEQGRDSYRGLASRNIDDYSDDAQSAYYEDRVNKKRVRELQEEFGWDRDEAEAALNNWYELDGVDADEFDREAGGDTNSAIYSAWETAQVEKENRSGFRSRGRDVREDVPGKYTEPLGKWWSSYDELSDSEKADIEQAYFERFPQSNRPGSRDYDPQIAQDYFEENPEKFGYAKDFRVEAITALANNGANFTQARNVTDYWMENDAIHEEYLKEADGDTLYAMALAYDNYIEAAADDYNERQRGFGSRGRERGFASFRDGMYDPNSDPYFDFDDREPDYDATSDDEWDNIPEKVQTEIINDIKEYLEKRDKSATDNVALQIDDERGLDITDDSFILEIDGTEYVATPVVKDEDLFKQLVESGSRSGGKQNSSKEKLLKSLDDWSALVSRASDNGAFTKEEADAYNEELNKIKSIVNNPQANFFDELLSSQKKLAKLERDANERTREVNRGDYNKTRSEHQSVLEALYRANYYGELRNLKDTWAEQRRSGDKLSEDGKYRITKLEDFAADAINGELEYEVNDEGNTVVRPQWTWWGDFEKFGDRKNKFVQENQDIMRPYFRDGFASRGDATPEMRPSSELGDKEKAEVKKKITKYANENTVSGNELYELITGDRKPSEEELSAFVREYDLEGPFNQMATEDSYFEAFGDAVRNGDWDAVDAIVKETDPNDFDTAFRAMPELHPDFADYGDPGDMGFASRGSSQDGELDSYGFGKPVKINRDDDWEMSRFDEIDRQSQQDFVAELEAEDYFADGDYDDADKLSLAADEWNGRGLEKRERYTDEMLGELYELENIADTFTDTERNGTDYEGSAFAYVEEIIKNPLSADFSDYEEARKTMDGIRTSLRRDVIDREESGGEGFASRGDSGSRTVQDFENLGNKYGARTIEDMEPYERAETLGKAKAELTTAINEAENMLDGLDEDSPEWERLFNAQQEMDFSLGEIDDMMAEMVTEKDRLDNAQSEAARLTGEANDLVETRRGITRPSAEDLDELSFEDAHYEYTGLMDDINYLVDENNLSVDWSEEKQSEIEKALRDGDYGKAEDMLYDVTQEIWDAADDKYRTAEAEYDDYPFLDEDNGFASRGSSRFDTMETPYSSAIEAVHYDRDTRELHVAFKPGQTGGEARYYTYSDVSPDYFDNEISGSNSIGRVINDVKKNHDVEVTNPRTVDAINGRGEVAPAREKLSLSNWKPSPSGDKQTSEGASGIKYEVGKEYGLGDTYYAIGYRETTGPDGKPKIERVMEHEGLDSLEVAQSYSRMQENLELRKSGRVSTAGGRSEIQDIDVRRSAALYESYYDPNAEELVVTFKDKDGNAAGSYIYEGVTADEANELASASSKGKIINRLKASKSVRRAGADDRMTRTPGAADEVSAGGYEAQIDSHWSKIGPEEQQRYFARAVDSAINAGTGTSADEITADAKARAYDDRQIAMMEMQAEELGMGYRKIDVGSSAALNRVEYDPDKRELRVEYRGRDGKGNGEFYVYQNVPQSVVDDIEASDSRGATLRRVRDDFEFRTEPAIPESAFYSMGDAGDMGERSNPKITNRTNANGFYLDENGRATNYNKRSYTTADIQKINGRRNGRDGFASGGRLGAAPDDAEYGRELAAQRARDRAAGRNATNLIGNRESEAEGLASRGSINESSTGQRIVPSRMHSDDREALAEITDPEERKQRIDELIEFYGPRIFAKPSKPKRKPSDYDEDGFLIENDGFASRQTSAFNPEVADMALLDKELDDNASIFDLLDRQSLGTSFKESAEYEPSINTTKWSDLTSRQKKLVSDNIINNNRAYFDKMWQNDSTLGEIDDEVGKVWDDEVRANVTSLQKALKKYSEDYAFWARQKAEEFNPTMSEKEIDDMLVDLGLSENDFERLFVKNMDAYELASTASDLENKRREIIERIINGSTPKTGGDRPKVDPLSILGGYSDGDVFGLTPRGFASRGESGVKRKTKEDVFADMQKQLIAALEDSENLGKWKLPWRRTGMPENGATGKKYSGSNWFFLSVMSDLKGYDSNKWATYNQWQGLGGQVRKGEKGTQIFVPMFVKGKEKADGTMGEGRIMFKAATVFNLKQIDGMPADFDKKEILPEAERVSDLEKTISEIPAVIKNGGDRAFFQPSGDFIQVPNFENFNDARSYYSTVAHELMHWTGGKGRLDRGQMGAFGTPEYAYEELIAEIASAIFMSSHDIEPDIQENHGPYLASWLKALKQDPDALQRAMTDAQKAVNYVLDISPNAKSKFSHGEKAEFDTPEIAVVGDPVVAVEGFASRGDWPTPGGYEPSEFDMRTALSQIGRGNLMAISGTRAKKRNNEMVLPVNRNQQVIVGYDGGSDTYFVRAEQIITNGKDKGKTRVLGQWDNVYADELGETAYQASLKPSMLSDENKTVWAQAFDHPQTGSLLDENGQVYENGLASGGDSMDPDELDAMDWAYDAAQDYLMEQEDMMPDEPSPEDGFASRMNLSTPEKNEIISIARGMNTPFTRSVVAQYDRNGELSDRQWDALNRMTLRGNRRGFPSRGDEKRPRAPKAPWSPEDRQRFADRDRLRSKKRPGKRRNGPDASEYGFGSRGSDGRPSIDMIESDIFFEGERNGRSWGFEPIISIVAEQFGGRKNMSNRQLAKELGVSEAVAEKMRKPGARTSDIYLLDDLRVRVAGADRSIWGPNNDPLAYYDESGRPITDADEIPDVEDLAPDAPGTRAPKEGGARTYIDPTAVFEEVGIDANASKYSIVRDNSDVFNRRVWDRIMTRGITEDEINALLKARKSSKRSADIYTPEQLGAVKQKRTDSMPLADIFKNQAFDSLRGKRGFPQQVAEAITEITGRRPAISTVKAFINQPRSSGSQTGRNPFSMSPAQIRLLLDNLGISAEEFEKFRSE